MDIVGKSGKKVLITGDVYRGDQQVLVYNMQCKLA